MIAPAKPFASVGEALSATAGTQHAPDSLVARMFATLSVAWDLSDDRLALLKDIRKALDAGQFFVTRAEGRDAAIAILDRLNEAVGDDRSEAVRAKRRKGAEG